MADEDLDRNEAATPYKLERAKQKGQVAKSTDVVSASVFAVAAIYLTALGLDTILQQFRIDQHIVGQAGRNTLSNGALWVIASQSLQATLAWLIPFFATLMIAAVLSNVLQTGPVLSVEPLKADFARINPVNGLKRVFSLRTIFELFRAIAKLVLLMGTAYYSLLSLAPQFYGLSGMPTAGYLNILLSDMSSLALKMALALGLIAAIDLIFTRREFAKKMRMSHRELKDESKNRDGDPRIRARMRELRNELRKRSQSLQKTKDADVLLTNPTHIAIALRYVHGEMESPKLIAKGSGIMASAMRQIAVNHRIPIVQSPVLARKLFAELPVDQHVPAQLFADVARIIVWVFSRRQQSNGPAKFSGNT